VADGSRVLIAGAGPVGLITALCLARRNVPVTVLEAEPDLTIDLRAATFHPPTLEMLEGLGLTGALHEMGLVVPTWQFRDRDTGVVAEFDLGLLKADTRYPYRLHCEQHKLARVTYEMLGAFPHAEVRFRRRVTDVTQEADHVTAMVETPDGPALETGAYLIGADGGRSAVRKAVGIEFEGFTWPEAFLVVSTTYDLGPHGFSYAAYVSDPLVWCALFKVPAAGPPGMWRIASPTDPDLSDSVVHADAFVQPRLARLLPGTGPYEIVHRGTYRVHQRVAVTLRRGRVLLAGDAAHVNNPLGGMGLNSGIHDGVILADTLARVWRGETDVRALDRYDHERRAINVEYVQAITIQNKRALEERDPEVRRRRHEEMRRTAEDAALARAYLLKTSMLASVRHGSRATADGQWGGGSG
jgi:3-(3-hydroxy-phenyl)propionate hydroxylase